MILLGASKAHGAQHVLALVFNARTDETRISGTAKEFEEAISANHRQRRASDEETVMEKDSSETYPIQLEVHFVPRQEWGATIEGRGRSSGAPQNTQILWSSSLSRQTLIFGRFVLTSVLLEQYVGLCGYHDSLWIMTRSIDCAGSSGLYKQDTAIIKRQRNPCSYRG